MCITDRKHSVYHWQKTVYIKVAVVKFFLTLSCGLTRLIVFILHSFCVSEHAEDEYTIACLLFVFVAVSIPKLARSELSVFRAPLEGMYSGGGGEGGGT